MLKILIRSRFKDINIQSLFSNRVSFGHPKNGKRISYCSCFSNSIPKLKIFEQNLAFTHAKGSIWIQRKNLKILRSVTDCSFR
jgi:hypothetical protein